MEKASLRKQSIMAKDYPVRVLEKGEGEPLLLLHSAVGAGLWTEFLEPG